MATAPLKIIGDLQPVEGLLLLQAVRDQGQLRGYVTLVVRSADLFHSASAALSAAGIGLQSAGQRISAKNASAKEAQMLNETRGTALLTMQRTVYDPDGRPVEYARSLYRASRYAFTAHLPQGAGRVS